MAIGDKGSAYHHLRATFDVGSIRDLTDGLFPERFAPGRPTSGFAGDTRRRMTHDGSKSVLN